MPLHLRPTVNHIREYVNKKLNVHCCPFSQEAKENYCRGKRDLLYRQKRPTIEVK